MNLHTKRQFLFWDMKDALYDYWAGKLPKAFQRMEDVVQEYEKYEELRAAEELKEGQEDGQERQQNSKKEEPPTGWLPFSFSKASRKSLKRKYAR